MELLDRYIHQISKFLSKKDREDTIKEIRSLLLDDIDALVREGSKEEDAVLDVLTKWGDPRSVAINYRLDKPLVSRELEPIIFLVFKMVGIFLPLGLLLARTIEFVTLDDPFTAFDLILHLTYGIPDIIMTLLSTYAFIIVIFVLIDRYADFNINPPKIVFDPTMLPPIPINVFKVKLFEEVFNVFASVLFLYLVNYQQGLIAIYYDGNREPLLNNEFTHLLPLINISVLIGLSLSIFHLYKRRKTPLSYTLDLMRQVLSIVMLFLLASRDIFNEMIIDGYDLTIVPTIFKIVLIVSGVGASIGLITNVVKFFYSADETKQKEQS